MSEAVSVIEGGSLVDRAVRRVREHIRTHDMKVGDTLPGEGAFAAQLGVSRAVMREAFSTLAALRQIDVGNGRKARVAAIDGRVLSTSLDHAIATSQVTVAEIWDVRRTLELRTAELAAVQRSDADARAILTHAEGMAASSHDLPLLIRHDIAFHQAIARASGNALFHNIIRSFEALMAVAVPTAWQTRATEAQRQSVLDQHRRLALTIADRDPAAAHDEMNRHFDTSIGDIFTAYSIAS
ncbi:FadR/GntR family transcriptional regulator [Sphingomonas sp. AR_OL41]|uniref:FadR/GntR family transcriptional regulator n=1 Tax=Sphingomonas sp. AR_OL41 TaxID=3042729 RepID=UPI002480C9DF|nr:FadR/GntR family transcriptional regulator [Sphingomonas sp. AR_OL41]MDH7975892.1 FadR/GntR family transcriptional regulator [Sphingomonas sp. AR_OL41]